MSFLDGDYGLAEGQRLEFKEASGGLPDDVWESYSAFANTEGGEIVLGVSEDRSSHEFCLVGVPDPDALVDEFWRAVRNPNRVSRDIMPADGVRAVERGGLAFVVITVPRAERDERPVEAYDRRRKAMVAYVRRGSCDMAATEGDLALMRYDCERSADRAPLERFGPDALDGETVARYRNLFSSVRPGSPWNSDSDEDFLYRVGALAKARDGGLAPTRAGLLAFGHEYEITNYLPGFLLDYRDETSGARRWDDRIVSQSGDWSGNVFDFHRRVTGRLAQRFPAPFTADATGRRHGAGNPFAEAVNEAVTNALVHAYYGSRASVLVALRPDGLTVSNPGGMLVDRDVAVAGGFSEPRNPTLMRIMSLAGAGDRAGSGLRKIWDTWRDAYGIEPSLEEGHAPASVTLSLPLPGAAAPAGDPLSAALSSPGGVTAREAAVILGVSERVAQKRLLALFKAGSVFRTRRGRSFAYRI